MDYLKILIGLVVIVNPLAAMTVYVSLVKGRTLIEQKAAARSACLAALIIMVITVWTGTLLLSFFGISLDAFRAAGGLIIILMALSMISAKMTPASHTPEEAEEAATHDNVGVVPLGIPLMAGPGTLSVVIVDSHACSSVADKVALSVIICGVCFLAFVVLSFGENISKKLGKTGVNIATRIMGMILAAIGVEFLTGGLGGLFPGLLK